MYEEGDALESSIARPLLVALFVGTVLVSNGTSKVHVDVASIITIVILASVADKIAGLGRSGDTMFGCVEFLRSSFVTT